MSADGIKKLDPAAVEDDDFFLQALREEDIGAVPSAYGYGSRALSVLRGSGAPMAPHPSYFDDGDGNF